MLPAASFNRPVMRLTIVVLPAPFGPINPVMRPGRTGHGEILHGKYAAETA
jgi:hypothetical protein